MDDSLATSISGRYRLAALIQAIEDDLRQWIRLYVAPYVDPVDLFGEKLSELRRRARAEGVLSPSNDELPDT